MDTTVLFRMRWDYTFQLIGPMMIPLRIKNSGFQGPPTLEPPPPRNPRNQQLQENECVSNYPCRPQRRHIGTPHMFFGEVIVSQNLRLRNVEINRDGACHSKHDLISHLIPYPRDQSVKPRSGDALVLHSVFPTPPV